MSPRRGLAAFLLLCLLCPPASLAAQDAARKEAARLAALAWEPFAKVRDRAAIEAGQAKAMALLEEAIRIDPDYALSYRTLGWIHFRLDRFEEAIPLLRKALSLPGWPSDTPLFLAQALEGAGRWAEVEGDLGPLAASIASPILHRILARALWETGRGPAALDLLEAYLRRADLPDQAYIAATELLWLCERSGDWARGWRGARAFLAAKGWPDDKLLYARLWSCARLAGQEAFALGDYGNAEAAYLDALECLRRRPDLAAQDMASVDLDGRGSRGPSGDDSAFRLGLVRERRALGAIRPLATLRVLALSVARVDAEFPDLRGRRVAYHNGPAEPEALRWRGICQGYAARAVEAWSKGRLSLEFVERDFPGAVTSFKLNLYGLNPESGLEMRTARLEGLSPVPEGFFESIARDFDILILYWNGEGGAASGLHGYARRLPDGRGGEIPALRGVMDIPLNLVAGYSGPRSLLHELFHVLESAAGIAPLHGYLPSARGAFPAWTGSTEMDYYRWHFETTFPALGWEGLSFKRRAIAR